MRSRLGAFALLNQINQRFVYERLDLTAFFLRKCSKRSQQLGIYLSGELFASL